MGTLSMVVSHLSTSMVATLAVAGTLTLRCRCMNTTTPPPMPPKAAAGKGFSMRPEIDLAPVCNFNKRSNPVLVQNHDDQTGFSWTDVSHKPKFVTGDAALAIKPTEPYQLFAFLCSCFLGHVGLAFSLEGGLETTPHLCCTPRRVV